MSDEAHRPAGPTAAPGAPPPPDVLAFGPAGPTRSYRRPLIGAGALVAVLLVAFAGWRLVPRPAPPLSLVDLQGVYAGMVRSDGTNEVSTVTRDKLTEAPATITPAECTPLFEATSSNQFPAAALDGVSTYWLNEGSATISLSTYRFADENAAQSQFDAIAAALTRCVGQDLTVDGNAAVRATPQPVGEPVEARSSLSFLVAPAGADNRFTTDLAVLDNTVTWQYRYDYRAPRDYSPLAAQQLMASMMAQMRAAQDAHR
jgi:hypothetical protein